MFFRLAAGGNYYAENVVASDEIRALMPEDLSLAYWDYYHTEKEHYDRMISAHKTFGCDVWFAGGAWSWYGFAPKNAFSMRSMLPAMQSVKQNGIKNVIITMWGDNGKDCSYYSLLPSLYAIAKAAEGVTEQEIVKQGFKQLVGVDFDDFMSLDYPDRRSENEKTLNEPLSKVLLFSDPFVGKSDRALKNIGAIDYSGYYAKLARLAENGGEYSYLFDNYAKLCRALELKYDLGVRTRAAYEKGDKAALLRLAEFDYPEAARRIDDFHESFSVLWHKENKAFGFEVQDVRLGGIIMRLNSCAKKIKRFLSGEIPCIEQLEKPLLAEKSDEFILHYWFDDIITYNAL